MARLQSELLAANLEVKNARDIAAAEVAQACSHVVVLHDISYFSDEELLLQLQARTTTTVATQDRQAAEVAVARVAAQTALVAELELLRRQKAAAEEQARRANHLVRRLLWNHHQFNLVGWSISNIPDAAACGR